MLLNSPDLMMGTGSACSSGAIEPSHVPQAIGLTRNDASSTIRISLGKFTEEQEICKASTQIIKAYKQLRNM